MKKEYSWKVGRVPYSLDANEVGKELEKLDELTPANVVNLARDENNILHSIFEWDDTIAAEKWRKTQASRLITNLQINIIKDDEEKPKQVRAFVTLEKNTTYEPIEKVVSDTDKYAMLLDNAYRELNYIKLKYDTLTEIQELLADIPEVI